MENTNTEGQVKKRVHRKPTKSKGLTPETIFKIRQVLNLLFIVIGVIGAGIVAYGKYYSSNDRTVWMGMIIFIIGMAMKMSECVLRVMVQRKAVREEDNEDDETADEDIKE